MGAWRNPAYLPIHPPPPTVTNLHKCPLIWISHRHCMNIFFFWNKSATVSGSLALNLHIQFAPSRGIYFSFIGYWLHYIYSNFKMFVWSRTLKHYWIKTFFSFRLIQKLLYCLLSDEFSRSFLVQFSFAVPVQIPVSSLSLFNFRSVPVHIGATQFVQKDEQFWNSEIP